MVVTTAVSYVWMTHITISSSPNHTHTHEWQLLNSFNQRSIIARGCIRICIEHFHLPIIREATEVNNYWKWRRRRKMDRRGGRSVGMVGRKDEIIKREKWIERKITFCRYMKKTKVRVITPHMFIWHAQHSWGWGSFQIPGTILKAHSTHLAALFFLL